MASQDIKKQQLSNIKQKDLTNKSGEKQEPNADEISSISGANSASKKLTGSSESHSKDVKSPSTTVNKLPIVPSTSNHPPSARDDRIQTMENKPLVASVLDNDIDRDGDELNIMSVSSPTKNRGIVTTNYNGTITYSPATTFFGLDTFAYTVSDDEGKIDSAKVFVLVKPAQNNNEPGDAKQESSSTILKTKPKEGSLQTQPDIDSSNR